MHRQSGPSLVSIIIPAYNYAHYLMLALESALAQRAEGISIEVLVIDDGSTDGTPALAARYGDRIRYIRKENQGLSEARNTGIRAARGTHFLFLDADDALAEGCVATQLAALAAHPEAEMAVCVNQQVTTDTPTGPLRAIGPWPLCARDHWVHLCQFNIAPPHAYFTTRAVIERVGFFDPTLKACEDHDYWLRCAVAGARMVSNPEGLVFYRKHAASMSSQSANQLKHDAILHGRVSAMLHDTTFLGDCREAAWMAHASGCLSTACRLADIAPETSVQLLDRAVYAIKQAARARSLTGGIPGDSASLRTTVYLYANVVLDLLYALRPLALPALDLALSIIKKMYPDADVAEPVRFQMKVELSQASFVPQT